MSKSALCLNCTGNSYGQFVILEIDRNCLHLNDEQISKRFIALLKVLYYVLTLCCECDSFFKVLFSS